MDSPNYEHVIEVPADWGVWVFDGHLTVGCQRGALGRRRQADRRRVAPHRRAADREPHRGLRRRRRARSTRPCDYDRGDDRVLAGWGGGRVGFVQATARAYDEMAMYDRALPDERIAAHADARTAADDARPRARPR